MLLDTSSIPEDLTLFASAILIFLASLVIAKFVDLFLVKHIKPIAKKTKSTMDDVIVDTIRKPLFFGIILAGIYFALHSIPLLSEYPEEIDLGFFLITVLFFTFVLARVINVAIKWYAREVAKRTKTQLDKQFLPVIEKISYAFIYAIALILILSKFGIDITALVASLGIAGLAVALALQESLSNFFAGLYIFADKPVKGGDYIELEDGDRGYVEDVGWRSTRIRTLPNNIIIIPNSKLAQSKIINYYSPVQEMSVIIKCGVAYDSDLDRVEKVVIEVAKETLEKAKGGVKTFKPFIRYNEFGDSNINFSIILRVNEFVDKYLVTHEFIKNLKRRFDKEGIEISFPARKVYMRKT